MVSTANKNNKFSFEPNTADDISQQRKCLDINKVTRESDIPTKLVNVLIISELYLYYIYKKISIAVLKKIPSLKTLKWLLFIQPIKRTAKQKKQTIEHFVQFI